VSGLTVYPPGTWFAVFASVRTETDNGYSETNDELFAYFHSSQKDIKGGRNLSGLNDKTVDELVEKISRAKNKNELQNLTSDLDQRLLENYYTIPEWHNNTYRILYRDIFEFPKTQPKYSLALDSWYFRQSSGVETKKIIH
jgi:ABC-type oligopeptide transport system substrate-binding subunit